MRTLKITLAYDGTAYVGWQRQAAGTSIQGLLEAAIARIEGDAVTVAGAGRTDAGVHALGQVASVAVPSAAIVDRVRCLREGVERVAAGGRARASGGGSGRGLPREVRRARQDVSLSADTRRRGVAVRITLRLARHASARRRRDARRARRLPRRARLRRVPVHRHAGPRHGAHDASRSSVTEAPSRRR